MVSSVRPRKSTTAVITCAKTNSSPLDTTGTVFAPSFFNSAKPFASAITFIDSNSISRTERYSLTLMQLVQCGCQKTLIGAELSVLVIFRSSLIDLFPFRHSLLVGGTDTRKLVHLLFNYLNLNQYQKKIPPLDGFSYMPERFFGLSPLRRLEECRLNRSYDFSLKTKTYHIN